MKYSLLTDHHKVPESFWGTRNHNNILRIKEHTHQAFHLIMDNRTPVRQHEKLLKQINWQVHSIAFYRDMSELLDYYKWENELYAYRKWVLIPEKFLQAQEKFNY